MSKSIRVRTTPNGDDKYIKVELKQDFDLLEILSLKIKQKDLYQNFCSNYGVIAGRVIVNNGFGLPNVKLSIFIPIDAEDSENSVISQIYPYESTSKDDKNVQGVRYNLLPNQQQTFDHTPVGTFNTKAEILDDQISLEIYDKYYKFTTTTNESGDFILFSVPVGNHILHYDVDVSDIGFLSLRPYDLVEKGFSEELFLSPFKFKRDSNLDNLPQVLTQNLNVLVEPFWCDDLSTGRIIGITRQDIDITSVDLTPSATFFGSIFSDDEKDSINKNCRPRRKTGKLGEVITTSGTLEVIRRTIDGDIKKYEIPDDTIDDNGNWAIQLPMNIRKVITDEFGNLIPSPDGVSGIATEADFRFRISMDKTDNDKRLRQRAKYLVPNMTGNYRFDEYSASQLQAGNERTFELNEKLSTLTSGTPYSADTSNQYNYLEDFFTFRWKKVYTIRQFIGRYQKYKSDEKRSFLGIKHIADAEGVNKFPTNRTDTNVNPLYSILCILMQIVGIIFALINSIINFINGLITMLCQVKIPTAILLEISNCDDDVNKYDTNGDLVTECENDICGHPRCCTSGGVIRICITGAGFCKCLKLTIKAKCVLAPLFCKKCGSVCFPGQGHSCCRCEDDDQEYGCPCKPSPGQKNVDLIGEKCCAQCCLKIPMIRLKCDEVDGWVAIPPTLIETPFANKTCNQALIIGSCLHCGGTDLPYIGAWVACKLEGLAASLDMLKFDFYNDWINGTLYFPLIKRKYKVKKRKKKFGQIKKDKFCDFDCDDFQASNVYKYRTIIKNTTNSDLPFQYKNCKFIFKPTEIISTNWRSVEDDPPEPSDIDTLSYQEIQLVGEDILTGDECIMYGTPSIKLAIINTPGLEWNDAIGYSTADGCYAFVSPEHEKPDYVNIEDPITGIETQFNKGGHGHHQNKCNNVYRVEKTEFWQDNQDCMVGEYDDTNDADTGFEIGQSESEGSDNLPTVTCGGSFNDLCAINTCQIWATCSCTGVNQACDGGCDCTFHYNDHKIRHGIVKWEDGIIYYASILPSTDLNYNGNPEEYKGNLLLPTDICELGSSVFCDIDESPFIMDQIPPTTYQVSEESEKFKVEGSSGDGSDAATPINLTITEKDNSKINLAAYVTFSCFSSKCLNTMSVVNQSQIGVDMIDSTDIGLELGLCIIVFDHDEEIREYFCRRFSGFDVEGTDLIVNYQRPGSTQYENVYNTYTPGIYDPDPKYYSVNQDTAELSTVNDGDEILFGDRCGIKQDYNAQDPDVKYFYGLAPNHTNGKDAFVPKFPTSTSVDILDDEGINFGTSQTPYHFYFGIVPGKTALHKVVSKYFADKINKTTLEGLGDTKSSANLYNKTNFRDNIKNPFSILKSCLGEKIILPD